MSDLRNMSKQFITEFIALYRSYPCLWKVKSSEYSDRDQKNKAYEDMIVKLKEVDESATRESVKKKIDSMRGCFRKEFKKVKASKKSGAGADEVYKPHLWYYDQLLFLADQEAPRESVSNIEDDTSHSQDESNDTPLQSPAPSTENLHISRPLSAASDNTTSVSACSSITPRGTKKRVRNKADEVLDKVNARLDVNEDNFDVFGKSVAHKLRNLSPEAALLADKFISDILFEAALGNITRHTKMSLINDIRQHVQPEQASQHAIPRQHHQSANNVPNTSAYGYLSNQNDVDFSEQANTVTYYTQFSSDLLELN